MKWALVIAFVLTATTFSPLSHADLPYQIVFPSGHTIATRCPWGITNEVAYLAENGEGYSLVQLGDQVVIFKVPHTAPSYVSKECP